jgi:Got1/Sft2-like family
MLIGTVSRNLPRANRFVVLFSILVVSVRCTDFVGRGGGGWNLPPVTKQNRNQEHFLHECDQTLASIFNIISRGGGSSYENAGTTDDDWKQKHQGRPSQQQSYGSNEDNYYRGDGQQQYNDDYYSPRRNGQNTDSYDDYYDDGMNFDNNNKRNEQKAPSFVSSITSLPSSLPRIIQNGDRKIGLGLIASGAVFSLLGMSLFFNRTLMRIGNLLFIAGVPMTIGPSRTIGYFAKPEKIRATSCLALGIFLVFIGHPTFGIALEIFGLLNLFGNMFPMLWMLAKQMPGLSSILNDTGSSGRRTNNGKKQSQQNDDYYYDDYYDSDSNRQQSSGDQYGDYNYDNTRDNY